MDSNQLPLEALKVQATQLQLLLTLHQSPADKRSHSQAAQLQPQQTHLHRGTNFRQLLASSNFSEDRSRRRLAAHRLAVYRQIFSKTSKLRCHFKNHLALSLRTCLAIRLPQQGKLPQSDKLLGATLHRTPMAAMVVSEV